MSPYIGIGTGAAFPVQVCGGCRVEGFGAHRCYGEIVDVLAVGQARIHDCACAVELGCAGHQAAGKPPPAAQTAPFGYGVKR